MSGRTARTRALAVAVAAVMTATTLSTETMAMPFAATGASKVTGDSQIVDVQYRRNVKRRGNRAAANAAVGAAIGIGILGIAAAAAASQQRRGAYYTEPLTDAYGRPIYSYGQPRPVYQQYGQPVYREYEQPAYRQGPPPRHRRAPEQSWERQERLSRGNATRVDPRRNDFFARRDRDYYGGREGGDWPGQPPYKQGQPYGR